MGIRIFQFGTSIWCCVSAQRDLRYKTKRINGTFKQLNEKEPGLVSKEKRQHIHHRLYNTTKHTGIWYTKRPLIHYQEPKMIVDISGTYYRPGQQTSGTSAAHHCL